MPRLIVFFGPVLDSLHHDSDEQALAELRPIIEIVLVEAVTGAGVLALSMFLQDRSVIEVGEFPDHHSQGRLALWFEMIDIEKTVLGAFTSPLIAYHGGLRIA